MKSIFVVAGVLFLLAGVAGAIWGFTQGNTMMTSGMGITGATLIFVGVIFLVVGKYMGGLDSSKTLEHGIAGMAQVVGVQDTGVTINNLNAVIKAAVMVTIDGRPPYPAEVKFVLGRTQWGAIQPGMTIPVKVDPNDPQKVAFDPSRPVLAGGGMMAGATPGVPGMPTMPGETHVGSTALGQQVTTMSAADIIARGQSTEGVLQAVEPTGMTAGQVAPNLPPDQADDPITKVVFTFSPSGAAERRVEALVRVPDLKGHYLRPGERIPVAYLPDSPDVTATIDWSRL